MSRSVESPHDEAARLASEYAVRLRQRGFNYSDGYVTVEDGPEHSFTIRHRFASNGQGDFLKVETLTIDRSLAQSLMNTLRQFNR